MDLIPLNDLARTTEDTESILEAIERVVRSGRYILGDETERFEQELGERLNGYVVSVANGTDALILSLRALGISGPSMRVGVAPNAGGYGSIAAINSDISPVVVDVEPHNLLMSSDTLEQRRNFDLDCVIATHLYGQCAPHRELREWCDVHGIPLIEDVAQAIGASRYGEPVGHYGHISTYSFFPTKNLGALGDAGAAVTPDKKMADTLRHLRQYGWRDKYCVSITGGMNSRMDEIQAAVLRIRLKSLDTITCRRREILNQYKKAATTPIPPPTDRIAFVDDAHQCGVAHLAVCRVIDRAAAIEYFNKLGIQTDIHYPVLDHQNGTLADSVLGGPCPIAEDAVREILTLPCFPTMRNDEVERVVGALRAFRSA